VTGADSAGSFVDPYVYPGTSVLHNLLGIRDQQRLDRVEYELTYVRRVDLDEHPIRGGYDFNRLKETHRRLFQDIYEWAGRPRTVEINKGGSQFHPSAYIDTAASESFAWLAQSGLLQTTVDDDSFVTLSADLLEKINYIHPFRDGNGRTQRAFLDQIAALSGRSFSWRNVSPEEHLRASVNAFRDGHGESFRTIIRQAMRAPIDGLSHLDPGVYTVSKTTVAPAKPRTPKPVVPRNTNFQPMQDNDPGLELG
jgi:cell filamentation protein